MKPFSTFTLLLILIVLFSGFKRNESSRLKLKDSPIKSYNSTSSYYVEKISWIFNEMMESLDGRSNYLFSSENYKNCDEERILSNDKLSLLKKKFCEVIKEMRKNPKTIVDDKDSALLFSNFKFLESRSERSEEELSKVLSENSIDDRTRVQIDNVVSRLKEIKYRIESGIKAVNDPEIFDKILASLIFDLSKANDQNNESYRFSEVSIKGSEDSTPPSLYQSDVLCKNPGDCMGKKLKWNKCQVKSVGARMAYETYNIGFHPLCMICFTLCGCAGAPAAKEVKLKCSLKDGQPGLPCKVCKVTIKNMMKASFELWKAYSMLANKCKVPTNPFN